MTALYREHARAVRAFAQAVAEGDLDSLVAVLDPGVVWTADGGGRAIASRKPIQGRIASRARGSPSAASRRSPRRRRSSSTAGSAS